MMTVKNYFKAPIKKLNKISDNEFEIICGGGFYSGKDEYDRAASFILNNAKFHVNTRGGNITYTITEFDGEKVSGDEDVMDITTDIEKEVLYILNDCFLRYSMNGYEHNISGFKEFLRNSLRPMSIFG